MLMFGYFLDCKHDQIFVEGDSNHENNRSYKPGYEKLKLYYKYVFEETWKAI